MQSKEEIRKKISECENDEDILAFVKARLDELEQNSEEVTVGQNYTESFDTFISSKVHYKAAERLPSGEECPDLVYDDLEPYVALVKELKKFIGYNELSLMAHTVFWQITEYFPSGGDVFDRIFPYLAGAESGKLSIKDIKENKTAFCSERSGLAQNMFKFLGVDSSLIAGERDGERHAYNMVYPNGYGNKPAIIFDASHHLSFKNEMGDKLSTGFFYAMKEDEYKKILTGEQIALDTTRTEKKVRQVFGEGLDGYKMEIDSPVYQIGFKKQEMGAGHVACPTM